jgi:hypothetical protein
MGCGCSGGARRPAQAPKMQTSSNIVSETVSKLHPNAEIVRNIQRLSEERRKIERLRREQLLKALSKP